MSDDLSVSIRRVNPPELGAPPGYSHVVEVRARRIIFIAGQTALDRNGEIVGRGNFAMQAAQVFKNLDIALQAVGCTAANLIKLNRLSQKHGRSISLPRSSEPIFRNGHAPCSSDSNIA